MRLKQVVPLTIALSLLRIGSVSAETPTELSPALRSLNGRMHQALRDVVTAERQQLGPLIMFEDGEIKLYRGDQEVAGYTIVPPLAYDQLKIIGHATFAVVIQVHRSDLSFGDRKSWLEGFVSELQTVRTELESFELPEELEESQRALIGHTLELAKTAQHQEDIREAELRAFAQQVLPLLQDGFTHSARLHADLIHQQAEKSMHSSPRKSASSSRLLSGDGVPVKAISRCSMSHGSSASARVPRANAWCSRRVFSTGTVRWWSWQFGVERQQACFR